MNKTTRLALAAIAGFGLCAQGKTVTQDLWDIDFDNVTLPEAGVLKLSDMTVSEQVAFTNGGWTVAGTDDSVVTNGPIRVCVDGEEHKRFVTNDTQYIELDTQGENLTWTSTQMATGLVSVVDADIRFVPADDAPEGFDSDDKAQTALYLLTNYDPVEQDVVTGYQLFAWVTASSGFNDWQAVGGVLPTTFVDDFHHVQVLIDYSGTTAKVHVKLDGTELADPNSATTTSWDSANTDNAKDAGRVTAVTFKGTGAVDNFVGTGRTISWDSFDFTAQVFVDGELQEAGIEGNTTRTETAMAGDDDDDTLDVTFAAFMFDDYDDDVGKATYALSKIAIVDLEDESETVYDYSSYYDATEFTMNAASIPAGYPAVFKHLDDDPAADLTGAFSITPLTYGGTSNAVIAKLYFKTLGAYDATVDTVIAGRTEHDTSLVKPSDAGTTLTWDYPAEQEENGTNFVLSTVQVLNGATLTQTTNALGNFTVSYTVPEGGLGADTTFAVGTYAVGPYDGEALEWVYDPSTGTYTLQRKTFTVTFTWEDGSSSSSATYAYGDPLVVPAISPTYEDGGATYTFTGWAPATNHIVTAAVDYVAQYEQTSAPKATVLVITDNGDGTATTNTVGTYGSFAAAIHAATNGTTVVLLADEIADATKTTQADRLVVTNAITIDFGEYTYSVPGSLEPTANWCAIYIDADTTVKGTTGGINCLDKDTPAEDGSVCGVYAFNVRNGAKLTIEGGVYHGGGTVVQTQLGTTEIKGGTFSVTAFSEPYGMDYALNCVDSAYGAGTAGFDIKGGTFVGFDPQDNAAEGEHTDFTDEGFVAIVDGSGNYVVQPGYNVTFDANGGSPTPDAQRVAAGGTATAPTPPAKANYSFAAWQTNGVDWVFTDAVSSDMTLVADWTIDQFDVIWIADGAQFASNRVDYGAATPVPQTNPTKAATSSAVYTFTGWSPEVAATVTNDATYVAQFSAIYIDPASLELYPNCSNYIHVVGAPEGSTYTYKFAGQVGCDSYALNPPGWSKTEGWAWPYGKQPGGTGTITVTVSNNNAQVAQFVANVTVKDVAAVVDGVEYASADFANALAAAKSGDKVLEMYYYAFSYGKVALAEGESIRWKPADNRGKGSFWTSAATIPATTDAAWYEAVPSKDNVTGVTTITCVNQGVPYVKIDDGTTVTYSTKSFTSMNKAGATYTLLRDMTDQTGGVVSKTGVILDLNGKKLGLATGIKVNAVKTAASLTIRDTSAAGTGEISGGNNDSPLVWVLGGDTVTIESGTFVSDGSTAVYTSDGGTATISGGTFSATTASGLLNCNDSNKGTITVTGGSFQGFDPANNAADGEGTDYVDPAYATVADTPSAGWYTVVPAFTVTWKNGETVLETDLRVPTNSVPSYNGETPVCSTDSEAEFLGWKVNGTGEVVDLSAFRVATNTVFVAAFDNQEEEHEGAKSEEGFIILVPADPANEDHEQLAFTTFDPAAGTATISACMLNPNNAETVTLRLRYRTSLTGTDLYVNATISNIDTEHGTADVTWVQPDVDTFFVMGFDNQTGVED